MLKLLFRTALLAISAAATAACQGDPASLPARDAHEGLLIAADPYQQAERCKERFGKKNPHAKGILAVEVFLRNDNNKPIRLEVESIRLLIHPSGSDRQRLAPLTIEEVADRILGKGTTDPSIPRRPFPGRGPKAGRSKEWQELEATLRATALQADILPPRSLLRGFLFFDLNHRYDWLRYARLYLPNLEFLDTKQPLMFFEIDLAATVAH